MFFILIPQLTTCSLQCKIKQANIYITISLLWRRRVFSYMYKNGCLCLTHMHDSSAIASLSNPWRNDQGGQEVEQTEHAHKDEYKIVVERESKPAGKREAPQWSSQRRSNSSDKADTCLAHAIDSSQLLDWSRIIDLKENLSVWWRLEISLVRCAYHKHDGGITECR